MKDTTFLNLTRKYIGNCLFLIAITCPDKISLIIFNLWSWYKNSKVSLKKLEFNKIVFFVVIDKIKKQTWYQVSKRNAIISFLSGFKERGESLLAQYGLEDSDLSEASIIVDCGANTGDFIIAASEAGFHGKYLAFEPSQKAYQALSENLSTFSSSSCFNKGLWFEKTKLKFYVSEYGADSSFEMPLSYTEIIEVETDTISSVFSTISLENSPNILLKIEAEGCEPEVIQGAEKFFSSYSGKIKLVVDVGFERGICEESTLMEVSKILVKHGFELTGYSRHRHVVIFER